MSFKSITLYPCIEWCDVCVQMYTQYIPLSVYDLQTWMGAPSIYVYDCSSAGVIVELFQQFASQHEREYEVSRHSQRVSNCSRSTIAERSRCHGEQLTTFHQLCFAAYSFSANKLNPLIILNSSQITRFIYEHSGDKHELNHLQHTSEYYQHHLSSIHIIYSHLCTFRCMSKTVFNSKNTVPKYLR